MNKIFFILLICFCNSLHAQLPSENADSSFAEPASPDSPIINNVSADTFLLIHEIDISMDSMAGLKKKKAFLYLKKLDSLLKAKQLQEDIAMRNKGKTRNVSLFDRLLNTSVVKIFFWTIAFLFILFILYNLLLSKGLFRKPPVSVHAGDQNAMPDNFSEQDFRNLVNQSYKLGDYRMTVRYLFLQTLQRLNEISVIEFAADKTNSHYAREISQDKRNEFSSLILNYEYVWYGNVKISKEIYDNIEKKFSAFLSKF